MASSVSFLVDRVQVQGDLAPGTANDDAAAVLRKFTNPSLVGPGWDALIAAIAAGDQVNWDNALAAFDQIFISTASGKYLERAAANYGEVKPALVGMDDPTFRALSIIKKNKKLTQEAFLEVLEIFYGPEAVRGVSTSTGAEPFSLVDQDTLVLLLDEKVTVTVTFDRTHYTAIAAATALEVSGEINRAISEAGSNAYAVAYIDPTARSTYVRVYSGSRGLSSSVRVIGGSAQRWLQFPTPIFDIADFSPTTWTVSSPKPGIARFSTTSVGFDLGKVRPGDLVCIYGDLSDPFAVAGIQGTFSVTAIDKYYVVSTSSTTPHQYFEIAYVDVPPGAYAQTNFTSAMFFRPTKATLYDQQRHVIVTQLGKVELPATTNIVRRGPGSGAYLNVQPPISLVSLIRAPNGIVTGTTAAPHGMSVGDQVFIDGATPTGAAAPVTAGTPSGALSGNVASGTTDASLRTTCSPAATIGRVSHACVTTPEGVLAVIGGFVQSDPSTFTVPTNPVVLSLDSDTVLGNGGRRIGYTWKNLNTITLTAKGRAQGISVFANGQILITGGTVSLTDGTPATSKWDLLTYVVSPATSSVVSGSLPITVAGHSQCTLANGKALMSGGFGTGGALSAASYTFSPITLSWTAVGNLNLARKYAQMIGLNDGTALIVGGVDGFGTTNACELYNATATVWSWTAPMGYARSSFGALKLPTGNVFVFGGSGYLPSLGSAAALATAEMYDINSKTWIQLPPAKIARISPVVVYLAAKNSVVVTGGGSAVIELLDLNTMKWLTMPAALATPLSSSAGGLLGTDIPVVVGGNDINSVSQLVDALVVPGSNVSRIGGLNRQATIASVPTSSSFTYTTPDGHYKFAYVETTNATVTPSRALSSPAGLPGPYTYDTANGLAVTGTTGVLAQDLAPDISYELLPLSTGIDPNPANSFPDKPGYLAINFGFANQAGPVRYLGRYDNTKLLLDASTRLRAPIASGAVVTLLSSNLPFVPDPHADPLTGNFYLTSSAAGRIAAGAALDDIQAAGLAIERTVVYPSDRGLGGEGLPTSGAQKLSDSTEVWGGDSLDDELTVLREGG